MLTRHHNPLDLCNLKFNGQAKNGLFEGYASTFGNVDSFGDTIIKGAYSDTIKDRSTPVLMLNSHTSWNSREVIGKWLELAEDSTGLAVAGELTPGHSVASDIYASMKHGAISGLSIGFNIPVGGAEEIEGGGRRLEKIDLIEISVVSFPADSDARITDVKAIADEISGIATIRDCEVFLRDAGFSRSMAKAFLSQLRSLHQREADDELEQKEAMDAAKIWLRNLTEKR